MVLSSCSPLRRRVPHCRASTPAQRPARLSLPPSEAPMSTTILGSTYLLSPMQQGMLFHNLYAPQSGVFIQQLVATLHEEMDVAAFGRAWQRVVDRHPILRSSFRWEGLLEPVQDAHPRVALPIEQQDWRALSRAEQEYRLEIYLRADRRRGFDLDEAPLMRLSIFRLADDSSQFV